jgi:hypothetical protein
MFPKKIGTTSWPSVRLRCPHCRHQGLLERFPEISDLKGQLTDNGAATYFAIRRCPNNECRGVIFAAVSNTGQVLESHPPEVVDWDASNLPTPVVESLEECVQCLAVRCFRASALMARRTLELVCDDQDAKGHNLQTRLAALGTKAVVPAALLDGLDALRLLGNDAAHVNAKDYEQVGETEARLALDVTKELLKAVYQYTDLVARLEALKMPRANG